MEVGKLRSLFLLACLALAFSGAASALEFRVGGVRGWREPLGNETDMYNRWATVNRFHVGDSVYFKYRSNDSVLVVDGDDYGTCDTASAVLRFQDGSTTVTFDRHGFFYFISGEPGHCQSGQKLIVRVMVHSWAPAPAPQQSGGSGGGQVVVPPGPGAGPSSALAPVSNSGEKLMIGTFSTGSSSVVGVLFAAAVLVVVLFM